MHLQNSFIQTAWKYWKGLLETCDRSLDRIILVLGILGFATTILITQLDSDNLPVRLQRSPEQIRQIAQSTLQAIVKPARDYQSALSFSRNSHVMFYLEQTIGIKQTKEMVQKEKLPIYYWNYRWFKPNEQEEYDLGLSTDGTPIRFNRTIEETKPGPKLKPEEAKALAETYLKTDRGWNLAQWESMGGSSKDQPSGRRDHSFDWRRREFSAGKAELRLAVTVQGDQIGRYLYWIKTPEEFGREFSKKQNIASTINRISYDLGYYGAWLGAAIAYIVGLVKGQIAWKEGIIPALMVGGSSILGNLNSLPLSIMEYSTTENIFVFWMDQIYAIVYSSISYAMPVFFLWPGGRWLAKKVWPYQDKILTRSTTPLLTLARSSGRGLLLSGIWLGYVTIFYIIATKLFGAWVPSFGFNYSNLFTTQFPFLNALNSGIGPGITEELQARLVGVSLGLLITRNRSLALLIPGILWSFAHLSYVREPFFLRGIELLIPALIDGFLFVRFDLVTTIMSHVAYNSLLSVGLLVSSGQPNLIASGIVTVVVLLIPTLPGLHHFLRGKSEPTPLIKIIDLTADRLSEVEAFPIAALSKPWLTLLEDAQVIKIGLFNHDQLIGLAVAEIQESHSYQASVMVLNIRSRWRRQYYGSQLLAQLSDRLHDRNIAQLQVEITWRNDVLQRFWNQQNWPIALQVFNTSTKPRKA